MCRLVGRLEVCFERGVKDMRKGCGVWLGKMCVNAGVKYPLARRLTLI